MPTNTPEITPRITLENDMIRPGGFSRKWLFAAGLSLVGGVLWLSSCAAPPEERAANNGADANVLVAKPTPTQSTPAPAAGPRYILFLPNDDAMLSRQVVRDTSTLALATYEQKAQRVLELLFQKLSFLPEKTRLVEAPKKMKDGVVRLNFSKPFLQLDTAPDTAVLLILDAICRTLGALDSKGKQTGKPAKVLIVVEGKTVREFNQFSLAEPWEPSEFDQADTDKMGDHPSAETTDDKLSDNKITDNKITDNKISDAKAGGGY